MRKFEIIDEFNNITEVKTGDKINPDYYTEGIETTKDVLSHKLGFCEGNRIKYLTRYKQKNGLEDLLKAQKYLRLLIADVIKKVNTGR